MESNVMKQLVVLCVALAFGCTVQESSAPAPAAGGEGSLGRSVSQQQREERTLGDKSGRATENLTRFVEYYDGDVKRKLWVSDDVLVELAPSEDGKREVLASDAAAEDLRDPQRGVRVWRVRAPQGVDGFARNLTRDALRFSPALHESASSATPICALPGGVVATFKPDWDRARIDAWVAGRNMKIAEEIAPSANMFLLATPPGLESVEVANRLQQTGELVGCTPNLWRQATTR